MRWRQGIGRDEGCSSSSEEAADGKPTHSKGKPERAAQDAGKERKPQSCYFCDGPHRVSDCPVHKRLTALVRAKEESERENTADERHRGEPKRLGAIQVQDGHHEEQPKRVMWLGALQLCREEGTSQDRNEGNKSLAEECHEKSPGVQPDPSHVSQQRATRRKRRMRRQRRAKGPTSEGAKRSHTDCNVDQKSTCEAMRAKRQKTGTRRRRHRCTRVEQVQHSPSNEGIARLSGAGCHGPSVGPGQDVATEGPYPSMRGLDCEQRARSRQGVR
ncbi:hypothetical protein MRB53_016683 [Persea americana]|uniref:Uncharacterized protein n=1 Tax=Persea americana TaxID=3435 RepID=A0ACC2M3S0_PERAE|nr:hypothetical protein MRB53_016683 [Persea americana]